MGATARLAEWAIGVRFEDLPAEAVAAAKRAILDCLGCALAAADERGPRALLELAERADGDSAASVLGYERRTTPRWAAFVNGTLAHALDFDDTHPSVHGHPTAGLLPAALALGETHGASGANLVAAYVVGLELMGRLGRVINLGHYDRGWHSSSTLGAIGAAAAGARMLGLDPGRFRYAFGIAASFSSGIRRNFGTDMKPLQVGAASRNGVLAAQLAAAGVDADPNVFEGRGGFCAVAGEPGQALDEASLGDLGRAWQVVDPGLGFKRFPSCYSTHRAVNAMLGLAERFDLRPEQVEAIDCATSYAAKEKLRYPRPTTALEAKFSMEFCLAAALIDRRLGLQQLQDDQTRRAEIQALLPRISVRVHPELERPEQLANDFAEVAVRLTDGRVVAERVDLPPGHPKRPLTDAELDAKLLDCAGLRLGRAGAERVLELLRGLERLASLRDLTAALAPSVVAA